MKNIMLLIACVWWHNTNAQKYFGVDQYYSVYNDATLYTPIVWYQAKTGWYAEARYNYEAENSISLYTGKTIEREGKLSYSVNTIAGIILGGFKGGSVAVNAEAAYGAISFSFQSQYVFSVENRSLNYTYIWSDASCRVYRSLSAGISLQHTNGQTGVICEKGFFVKTGVGKWSVPLYIFNPFSNGRYIVAGLNYSWQ